MSKEKQLFKNTAIVSLGKICTQLITFFLLPLYTYILTAEEYGIVDLLNNLVSLLIPIVILQIDQGVFRYLLDCRGQEEKEKGFEAAQRRGRYGGRDGKHGKRITPHEVGK